jgi:ribosome-associated protein
LDDDKAENVVSIPLSGKSSIADYMVVSSGTSTRQVGAMADHLVQHIKAGGFDRPGVEGLGQCDWVLIDAGDVIVHLFRPEVREFYNLEKMWTADLENESEQAAL